MKTKSISFVNVTNEIELNFFIYASSNPNPATNILRFTAYPAKDFDNNVTTSPPTLKDVGYGSQTFVNGVQYSINPERITKVFNYYFYANTNTTPSIDNVNFPISALNASDVTKWNVLRGPGL